MCVCLHICMYVCMHACMYVVLYVSSYLYVRVWVHVCMYVFMYGACIYAWSYVRKQLCMQACIYACMHMHAFLHACPQRHVFTCLHGHHVRGYLRAKHACMTIIQCSTKWHCAPIEAIFQVEILLCCSVIERQCKRAAFVWARMSHLERGPPCSFPVAMVTVICRTHLPETETAVKEGTRIIPHYQYDSRSGASNNQQHDVLL